MFVVFHYVHFSEIFTPRRVTVWFFENLSVTKNHDSYARKWSYPDNSDWTRWSLGKRTSLRDAIPLRADANRLEMSRYHQELVIWGRLVERISTLKNSHTRKRAEISAKPTVRAPCTGNRRIAWVDPGPTCRASRIGATGLLEPRFLFSTPQWETALAKNKREQC